MPPAHAPPHGHALPDPSQRGEGEEGHPWPQQGHEHGLHLPAPLERMKESAVHAVEGVKLRLHLSGAGGGGGTGTAEERTGGLKEGCAGGGLGRTNLPVAWGSFEGRRRGPRQEGVPACVLQPPPHCSWHQPNPATDIAAAAPPRSAATGESMHMAKAAEGRNLAEVRPAAGCAADRYRAAGPKGPHATGLRLPGLQPAACPASFAACPLDHVDLVRFTALGFCHRTHTVCLAAVILPRLTCAVQDNPIDHALHDALKPERCGMPCCEGRAGQGGRGLLQGANVLQWNLSRLVQPIRCSAANLPRPLLPSLAMQRREARDQRLPRDPG